MRESCAAQGGAEVDTQGDAFFFAFPDAPGALAASRGIVEGLSSGPVQVRVGLHTGTPLLTDEGYVGADVHRAARIAASGHGGQVLVSATTAALGAAAALDLGEHRFKDLAAAERVFQLGEGEFPPIKSLYRTNLPVPTTAMVGRRTSSRRSWSSCRERSAAPDADRPGRYREDAARDPGGGRGGRGSPDGIWWVSLAPLRDPTCSSPRSPRRCRSRSNPAASSLPAWSNAWTGTRAASARQRRAPSARSRPRDRAASRRPAADDPRHEPRASPASGRARLRGPHPRGRRRRGALHGSRPARSSHASPPRGRRALLASGQPAAGTGARGRPHRRLLAGAAPRAALPGLDLLKAGRDADPRQQTLRATIEWSYDLLDDAEQRLFRGLSVFAGGCTYESAEAACAADPDTLQSLLDKSLLRRRDERPVRATGCSRRSASSPPRSSQPRARPTARVVAMPSTTSRSRARPISMPKQKANSDTISPSPSATTCEQR